MSAKNVGAPVEWTTLLRGVTIRGAVIETRPWTPDEAIVAVKATNGTVYTVRSKRLRDAAAIRAELGI